jgi:pilus assembly protein Flp/PilA
MNTRPFRDLIRDSEGASALEMGLICALIVVAMFSALQALANTNTAIWTNTSNQVRAAVQTAS